MTFETYPSASRELALSEGKPAGDGPPHGRSSRHVTESLARAKILGKSPLGAFLRLNAWIWPHLPRSVRSSRLAIGYCHRVHRLARLRGDRRMSRGTFFLRNRPQLELLCRLADARAKDRVAKIAVLGCSLGADVYSIRWAIGSTYPDLEVELQAVDISAEILEVARGGAYAHGVSEAAKTPILERVTDGEMREMFDSAAGRLMVKAWLKEGIRWRVADAGDPGIVEALGHQDLVVANDFLCHMEPAEAEACLRNLARLVDAGGYLVVSGVDLDVRTTVATDLGWKPVRASLEEIHDGDPVLRWGWPWGYWGLEPLDKSRPDWTVRYASVFQLGSKR
ncbi:MAG TPA: CheR family methyltransferase [Candidatus Limnocylindria bacterium]|jgi:SAM-dependent methyltransferase|nr:CheR family methyltransferase [Candidatus Limnocylindria bacterium]